MLGYMKPSQAIDSARHFLRLVWDGDVPTAEALLASLDRLVAAYHETPDASPSDEDLDPPRDNGASLHARLAQRFPAYGIYPVADPAEAPGSVAMVGDAIDDLADLTLDMREVVWLADQGSIDDAHWSFRLHFFHWGRHARELSLYLHARLWGASQTAR